MSWLKLNDSLNKVKGQITSFAQEVLAEGIVEEQQDDDGQSNPVRDLHEAREKIGELTGLCATQDQEVGGIGWGSWNVFVYLNFLGLANML